MSPFEDQLKDYSPDVSGEGSECAMLRRPELEYLLDRKGVSNRKVPLTIIIPVLNDNDEVNLTIQSIRQTSPKDVEVIVVDDCSYVPVALNDREAKLIRFEKRRGAGEARHHAATLAQSEKLLLLDSHMRFTLGWYENAMANMEGKFSTLWCGVCLGLSESNMDVTKPAGHYKGADLVIFNESTKQVFEGVWKPDTNEEGNYEIPCVMGACYFVHKQWFLYIKGLECNKCWGYEEPFLSIKTWLAGGSVRLMRNVAIGHKFRSSAPYSTACADVLYNKLRYMFQLLPEDVYKTLLTKIENSPIKVSALNAVQADMPDILKEKNYYKSIFVRDFEWLCNKFQLTRP